MRAVLLSVFDFESFDLLCSCGAAFRYNAELCRHELHKGHGAAGSTAGDRYQARFRCGVCGEQRRSRLALQKHKLKSHTEDAVSTEHQPVG